MARAGAILLALALSASCTPRRAATTAMAAAAAGALVARLVLEHCDEQTEPEECARRVVEAVEACEE